MTSNRNIPALTEASLDRLALRYVERYATTRAKLIRYLERKLYERGWDGSAEPPLTALVERFVKAGYVDDSQFAVVRAASMTRRGYGVTRVRLALRAAGIDSEDSAEALAASEADAIESALAFARKRKIGRFSILPQDDRTRHRALAAMLRAGHEIEVARRIVNNLI